MKRILPFVLSALILGVWLSACAPGQPGGQASSRSTAPGGYLETPCPLPENTGVHAFKRLSDGRFALLASTGKESLRYYTSVDLESWTGTDIPLAVSRDDHMCIALDGGFYLLSLKWPRDGGPEQGPYGYFLSRFAQDGQVVHAAAEPVVPIEAKTGVYSIQQAGNGALLLDTTDGIWQLDDAGEQASFKYLEDKEAGYVKSFAATVSGDKDILFATFEDSIASFDMSSGNMLDSHEVKETTASDRIYEMSLADNKNCRVMAPSPEGDALFYCDVNGISRHIINGGLTEEIMDGAATSLNMPTRKPNTLIVLEDRSFAVLFDEPNGSYLARYQYSEQLPTDKTRLKVYSMIDSKRVRQAMGTYQIQHPDTRIDYTVATPILADGTIAVDQREALRTLTTELLAGKGPDVLVLDDLPSSAYVEKGVLLDLTDIVTQKAQSGEWLSQIVMNYREKNGRIYGVPTRFNIPFFVGPPEAAAIRNFHDLADWLVQAHELDPAARVLRKSSAEDLLMLFYPICESSWYREGKVDRAALAQFLTDIQRVAVLDEDKEKLDYWYRDTASWYRGMIALDLGVLRSVEEDAVELSSLFALGEREARVALLPGDRTGYYEPLEILGVNAASAHADTAKLFLEEMLSYQVQDYEFFDGFPVNAPLLREQLTSDRYSAQRYQEEIWYNTLDSDGFYAENTWPDAAFIKQFESLLDQLSIPVMADIDIMEVFFETCYPFFNGEPLETCIDNYCAKIALVEAE